MTKALIIVQGINHRQGYLYDDVIKIGFDTRQKYDRIIDFPVNQFFDKKKNWILGDTLGDIWTFYKDPYARMLVCNRLREQIQVLQESKYEVDILAHSLGTIITLCCGPHKEDLEIKLEPVYINKMYLMGSPLGIGIRAWRYGWLKMIGTIPHIERYGDNISVPEMIYMWSKKDLVSKTLDKRPKTVLEKIALKKKFVLCDNNHDSMEYLIELIKTLKNS